MTSNSTTTQTTAQTPDLHHFTQAFFEFFGATVERQNGKKEGSLQIALTPELTTHFGKSTLQLCFHQSDLSSGQELVTAGSRIFDRMLAYLDLRGALTLQRLPSRFRGSEELLKAIRPLNASIAGLRMQEQVQHLYLFNWRITYRSDDKQEELYTVVLDEGGAHLPHHQESHRLERAVDVAQLLADAEPAPPEKNEEGQPIPPRLPPMAQLARLAESARKYAIYHADQQCASHEADILPRLYKALNRLTNYYQQQMEEIYDAHDPGGERRQRLATDLQRKLAEEVENHRLRVEVKLISYAILQSPVATADITLHDGKREITVRVRSNRYNGVLQRPHCYGCGQEIDALAIDHNGHITCEACLQQCGACQELVCARCGVMPCPACGKENCERCGQSCWACGERACAEHINPCPICGDAVCHACQTGCTCCGVRQCRSHLRVDHVAASRGAPELICAECAVRCPGCQQYSGHIAICSSSGQRFCTACLVTCTQCGQLVGAGFYHPVDNQPYCRNCLVTCPTCQSWSAGHLQCTACRKASCHACGKTCAVCQQRFCSAHIRQTKSCQHPLCYEHATACALCTTVVCPVCDPVCGICERPFCPDHAAVCQQCGCTYCRECVRRSGLCDSCATMHREGVRVNLASEPCAADPNVARLMRHYQWMRTGNSRYIIYVGESNMPTRMVVVVDTYSGGQQVVGVYKVGPLNALTGKLWR
jgi:hypothetical protein